MSFFRSAPKTEKENKEKEKPEKESKSKKKPRDVSKLKAAHDERMRQAQAANGYD